MANTIHAAGESAGVPPGTFAVALATADQVELEQVESRLSALQVPYARIVEAEGPYAGQLMAIGVEPIRDRSLLRKAVSSLPLIR